MSDRRLIAFSAVAAAATLGFAALVFAGTLDVPPAPPAPPASTVGVVPPAPPAPAASTVGAVPPAPAPPAAVAGVPPVPAAPPVPPTRHRHGRVHIDDRHVRFAGETLVVESDGDTWVIDDPATVRRFRNAVDDVETKARAMAEAVAKMHPAIKAAEEIGRAFENDPQLKELEREIERSVRTEIETDLEADFDSDIARALAHAEAAGRRAEAVMKKHEAKLRQMERELDRFERELESLEVKIDVDTDALENDLEEILDQAFAKGLAKKVE